MENRTQIICEVDDYIKHSNFMGLDDWRDDLVMLRMSGASMEDALEVVLKMEQVSELHERLVSIEKELVITRVRLFMLIDKL